MFCKHHMININLYTSWFTNQLDSLHLLPMHSNTWGPYIDTVQPVKDGCTLACLKNPRESQHMSNGVNPLYSRKDVSEMDIAFCVSLIIPDELMYVYNKIRQTYVSKVIVFCVIPIVPESVISIRYQCFQNVGGFGGRSYGNPGGIPYWLLSGFDTRSHGWIPRCNPNHLDLYIAFVPSIASRSVSDLACHHHHLSIS